MRTPADEQYAAQEECGYGAIQLVRVDDCAVVRVCVNDTWIDLIREPLDNNFDHTIYPSGIVDEAKRAGWCP